VVNRTTIIRNDPIVVPRTVVVPSAPLVVPQVPIVPVVVNPTNIRGPTVVMNRAVPPPVPT